MSVKIPLKLAPIYKTYIWGIEEWMLSDLHEGVEQSPLLVKIILAKENLSVQVHPGNEYAMENEKCSGKTEMWYILDCEPDAYLYYGLKHKISAEEFIKRIKNDTILEVCQKTKVKKEVKEIPLFEENKSKKRGCIFHSSRNAACYWKRNYCSRSTTKF